MSDRLSASCEYLSWRPIARAVFLVFRENQGNESNHWPKASADAWCLYEHLRESIWTRARDLWCQQTALRRDWFPYSVDAVVRLYFRFRKRNEKELQAFHRELWPEEPS